MMGTVPILKLKLMAGPTAVTRPLKSAGALPLRQSGTRRETLRAGQIPGIQSGMETVR